MSATFTYQFSQGTTTDTITVNVTTPATNNDYDGFGYAVTSISGNIGSSTIGGEVGTGGMEQADAQGNYYDNTVFTSDAAGFPSSPDSTSSYGIDADGLEFTIGTQEYNVYYDQNAFYLYNSTAGTSAAPLTLVSSNAPCYCPGTLILTDRGNVPVEALVIGHRVVTASGKAKPIRWIGRRSYTGRFIYGNRNILPVCVHAGSLGNNLPHRDLWVSPLHAMFLDDVLVPAGLLVNGTSITQALEVEAVEYIHVELDQHDVIFAEGAPSESFVDDNSRGMFHNVHEFSTLYPGQRSSPAVYCAQRVEDGEALEAIKREIDLRAGLRAQAAAEKLRGQVDAWHGTSLTGWAQNPDKPEVPVCLEVLVDGIIVSRTLANQFRPDLLAAGLGSGRHAFRVELPADDGHRIIEVRRVADGRMLGANLVGTHRLTAA